MKVLHVIDSGGLYGAEVMLLNLVAEQFKIGLYPIIGSIGQKHIPEKPLEVEALRRGFKVQQFRFMNGPNLLGALKMFRFCRNEGIDIVHSHGYKGNILFGFITKIIRKIPLVTTLHGWTSTAENNKMRLYEWLDAKSFVFFEAVVVVSRSMLQHSRLKNCRPSKLHVVPNGIPAVDGIPEPSPILRDRLALLDSVQPNRLNQATHFTQIELDQMIVDFCAKGFPIVAIGRLSPEKGHKYLIVAVHLLCCQGIDAKLVIIGEGNERKRLEDMATSLGLTENVFLPGYRSHAARYLTYFRAFVLPSLTEGLPITLLEAIRARIPVVATDVGGIPELIQDSRGGLLVKPRSASSLATALKSLYDNKDIADTLTQSAFDLTCAKLTSRNMALIKS